ncbi:two-component sensor histidine kinase [Paenibacillus sp. CAA11]|uniref:sensor histidine kinase n=1 Tax=Paenibacillus sp. CAA11 TaxID=1532905 RepID=UPI000D3CF96E|nr:HAMP domain-containing sensor histidine kinase [Paenibacillus sp. CAA11]AWB43976.1 two-component sensor histidine kinase [Paenibacillus sp. CAA11]
MSIRLRLTAWYTGILCVTLILFGATIYSVVRYNIYTEVRKKVMEQALQIRQSQNLTITQGWDLQLDTAQRIRLEDARIFWQNTNYVTNMTTVSQGMLNRNLAFPVPSLEEVGTDSKFVTYKTNGTSYSVLQVPITLNVNGTTTIIGLIQLATNTAAEDRIMDQMRTVLLFGTFATLIVASTFGLFLARKSMSPIGKVINAAEQIRTGNDLSVRIDYDGPPDEIGRLIGTVNGMLARTEVFYKDLEEAYAAQRRFVSDASHELRTPLTTIRGNVDLLKKVWSGSTETAKRMDEESIKQLSIEAVSDIADESKRMSRLVNDMLSLARADAGQTIELSTIELNPLVDEVVRRAQFLPRNAEWIQGDLSMLQGVFVHGNKEYLQQMLFIFIENAFKYTPSGSVTIDAMFNANQIGIRIADTGIGMDRSEVPYIFERFYRADQSRGVTPGTGLGLSIAKWIIDEHQGSVEVLTRKDEGTTFIIWLPAIFHALPE